MEAKQRKTFPCWVCPKCHRPFTTPGSHEATAYGWCKGCIYRRKKARERDRERAIENKKVKDEDRRRFDFDPSLSAEQKIAEKRERIKWQSRKRRYGVTRGQYRAMVIMQNEVCAICGQSESRINHRKKDSTPDELSIDHCHKTGKVRGLLCRKCNLIIGLSDDNKDKLKAAINYLEKYEQAVSVD